MISLKVFTRKPTGKNYPAALANSVHFAVWKDGKETVLNQDYGILFAKAKIKEDTNVIYTTAVLKATFSDIVKGAALIGS